MARNSRTEAIRRNKCRSMATPDGTEHLVDLLGNIPTRRRKVVRFLAAELPRTSATPATVFGRR